MFEVLGFINSVLQINKLISSNKPCLIGKIGTTELQMMYGYHYAKEKNLDTRTIWGERLERDIDVVCGLFPRTEDARLDFCNRYIKSLSNTDIFAAWNTDVPYIEKFEKRIIKFYSPNCLLVDLLSLEPFYSGHPWTKHLKGKNVLVISPFADTIQKQYKNKSNIWSNKDILPDFNLITLKHPTSKSISTNNNYNTWNEMVDDIFNKMSSVKYDVCLIGAGAASIPYANFAKENNKQAIHLGGGLQVLFGIKGARWDNMDLVKGFFNEYWVRPSGDEVPEKAKEAENGCYW